MSAELWNSAATVLDRNWSEDHMVASRHDHPHQRGWDAAFIAIGLAYLNPARAWRDLRSLFETQRPDGRIPHVQPPLHAVSAWEVYRRSASHGAATALAARSELAWLYPRLVAQQRYLSGARDIDGTGLAGIVHPAESGLDNSPAWDAALAGVPADPLPSYREGGYADPDPTRTHPFLVECPSFNAIVAAAELALARMAEVLGEDPKPHRDRARRITAALVDTLWDQQTRTFRARDVRTGRLSPARCVSGLVPLILPGLPAEQITAIMAEARSPRFRLPGPTGLPVPSYDRTAADFDPERAWRGSIGITVNWLLRRGMLAHGFHSEAEDLRTAMLRLVHRSGHVECYHPQTGQGIGAAAFSGTAALAVDLLADRSVPAYAHAA